MDARISDAKTDDKPLEAIPADDAPSVSIFTVSMSCIFLAQIRDLACSYRQLVSMNLQGLDRMRLQGTFYTLEDTIAHCGNSRLLQHSFYVWRARPRAPHFHLLLVQINLAMHILTNKTTYGSCRNLAAIVARAGCISANCAGYLEQITAQM